MSVDMNVLLQNIRIAFLNQQEAYGLFLLDTAMKCVKQASCSSPFDVGMGLHRGLVRMVNEDCLLAFQGVLPHSHKPFGLFVVCDGMGGHAHGQEAAHTALQNLLEYLLPPLLVERAVDWEVLLSEGTQQANRAIYSRNQSPLTSPHHSPQGFTAPIHNMGTTLTAALLIGETAYIANVGDSRIYLYAHGLCRITRDHSLVASLVEQGLITEEERYMHPERNKVTRALGAHPSVVVDMYVLPLPSNALLLLCSDGVWEMVRDRKIEECLVAQGATASEVANQFVQRANEAGGTDNIGCIVVQLQQRMDISVMETITLDPVTAVSSTKILNEGVSGG